MIIPAVKKAAKQVGGLTRLAAALGVKHPTFHSWKRVPAERVLEIERLTGISRHNLRPDIFGPSPERGLTDITYETLVEARTTKPEAA